MSPVPGTVEGERFPISPRYEFGEDEWFGLEANPEGVINVPFVDHYLPDPECSGSEDHPETRNTSRKAPTVMAGETTITVIGNLTNDPELRFTPGGSAVANFTVASTPRTFDRQKNEWVDGETLFLRAAVWRDAAEHVAESLTKGMRVIVSGVLKSRTYETKEGEKRTVVELEVDEIGPSLRYATATVTRAGSVGQGTGRNGGADSFRPVSEPTAQFADDDPWFGKDAKPDGRIHHPGSHGGPAFG